MQSNKLILSDFSFEAGGSIPQLEVVYHTSPRSYQKGDRVVWITHALTANSDAEDWWPELVGPGKFINTDSDFVVCVNIIGSAYGTTGPRSINPDSGKPYMLRFPMVTIRDIVTTLEAVRLHLGIEKVDLLVGSSIGGFQAVEWAATCPEVIRNAVFIATAARVTPWISAGMEAQRMALAADHTFLEQNDLRGGLLGLQCARAQGLITYRSYDGYCLTQAEEDDDCLFAQRAASYERYQGEKLTKRGFDAYSYNCLTYEVDSHNVGRNRGGVQAALAQIKAHTLVVNISTDGLFPPEEGREWAAMIPDCQFCCIHSAFGHDGFLLETEQLIRLITPYLER